ncbi:iron complex outermembrane receptor protein [Breznakibacter xylanolyticus]|uniref:Iron complex outermembrane receptor protein n=1 Tax=Breznakibacter xylanolyticus TaxID=990 RepID=A0A2W7QC74_9BACT|nr:TonB-dependent receptor [Breznakibacter xylanolyticus]PZX19389.1 iron complex outermembrane receptor protein [Breznakibacter xylanolyticus]
MIDYRNASRRWLAGMLMTACVAFSAYAQDSAPSVSQMNEEQIHQLSYNDLLQLSLEDLLTVANRFGMSADEILEYFLNKDIVAASKKSEKTMEAPMSSTVISKEQIEHSGATNIPEALRLAPGVIVREKTPGNYDVHLRGYDNVPSNNIMTYSENQLTLLMIDNRPVYSHTFGGTFWEMLPVEVSDVERIEIVRGPSSALYGPNAVTGAINIITKRATDKKVAVNFDNALGNNNSHLANIATSFGVGNKLLARVSGNYQWNGRFNNDFYTFYDSQYHTQEFLETTLDPEDITKRTVLKENASAREPNVRRAGEKYGANVALTYPASDKINFTLMAGAQKSAVLTSMLGNRWAPLSTRESQTQYIDLHADIHGFQAQINYNTGVNEYEKLVHGFKCDIDVINASLEYDYTIHNLTLRPGVSFQKANYNDMPYVNVDLHDGYMNADCEMSTKAASLRADYTAFGKWRLIGALRWDQYNIPDVNHFTYQFMTSFKINDNHLLRASYSRANRGPFITDTYSNYTWYKIPNVFHIYYMGNKNLKLPVMDMMEVGYRVKPVKYIQADFELYRTEMNDFSWFTDDSLQYTGKTFPDPAMLAWINYHNFDLKVIQSGFSANIQVAINKNLTMDLHGSIQQTELKDFFPVTTFAMIQQLQADAMVSPYKKAAYTIDPSTFVDQSHEATPSFYGGASINYVLRDKWNLNTSIYHYGKQTFAMNRESTVIDAKTLVNLKVSYNFAKQNKVFINIRNLLGDDSNEFAFADKIGTKFFAGVQLQF